LIIAQDGDKALTQCSQDPSAACLVFIPRGVGDNSWNGSAAKQIQIRRRFQLIGTTLETMQIWDIRRAIQAAQQMFPKATQFTVDGRADPKIQELSLRFLRPPNDDGTLDSAETKVERSDIAGLQTLTWSAGVTRRTLEERNQIAYRLFHYLDEQRPAGADAVTARALHLEYERTWRNVDELAAPNRGYVLSARIGGGPPGVSTRAYGRGVVQFASWYPVGRVSTINLRAEGGAVLATSRAGIPSALLFRTGGDTTVRGYGFETLGVSNGDAVVGGRYYAIGSAEAIRYVTPVWGIAAFVDAGNAGDNLSELRPVYGYGVGLRIRSPIGPLRLDAAYGQHEHQVRLHMSVGLPF
jgi:translocation and assembly module TamA